MSEFVKLNFLSMSDVVANKGKAKKSHEAMVIFVDAKLALAEQTAAQMPHLAELVTSASAAAKFKGKLHSSIEVLNPAGISAERLIIIGTGDGKPEINRLNLGGVVFAKVGAGRNAVVMCDLAGGDAAAAEMMLGAQLRAYKFDQYKTKKPDGDEPEKLGHLSFAVTDVDAAKELYAPHKGIGEGVILARNLVNEPPNVLFPIEFAKRAEALEKLGVEVEVLDIKALEKLGMRALLAVGQGSRHDSRVVIMRWNGAKDKKAAPVAFIGKGVTFDTGGISIKPASGMEDMKGDMAGAACVVGLMHALASRKAKANVVGAIGIVENMPDGNAYRPGDIVKSMSGQTIEIINTDAEGRLVLADVLWHVQSKFKPTFMIDLATLTGAILVALGQEYAGLFSNSDELSERLAAAGKKTSEAVWRLPLGKAYDKMVDSKFADMKNTGGRFAGSITAAQFLQRYVNDVPWAHLDIAGTGMAASNTDINHSWGPGWGVRLLNQLVADHYED